VPLLQKNQSPLWGIWKIEENCDALLRQLKNPEAYLPFLNRFKSESRKSEWLAVRVLLKELTGSDMAIVYKDSGAPYLQDSDLHISISHTKCFAAVIISPDQSVGIDIEYRSERIHRIKSRFLCKEEFELLGSNPATDDLLVFWSAKETVFKMIGQTTADTQNDIHIIDFKASSCDRGILIVQESLTSQSMTFQVNYFITPDFVLTHSSY